MVFIAFFGLRGLNLRIDSILLGLHCLENLAQSPPVNIAGKHVEKEEIGRRDFFQVIRQSLLLLCIPDQQKGIWFKKSATFWQKL